MGETAAAAAQANVDAKKADHSVKVGEQDHAQNAYDGAKPNLDSEQATLNDVILMLKGLQATNDYTLEAQTGTTEYCDGGSISVQFKVDGLWTERLPFITSSEKGDTHEKIFSLASKPSAIQFHADDNDGWCYVEAHITKEHGNKVNVRQSVIKYPTLKDANGVLLIRDALRTELKLVLEAVPVIIGACQCN